jgi:predicted DNA-binding transcriptional regulator YafY
VPSPPAPTRFPFRPLSPRSRSTSAAPSPLIVEQEWHEAQEVSIDPDGSLRLRFCVSGFAEVIREILKYGADVEVVEPAGLRAMVKDEIQRMAKLFR